MTTRREVYDAFAEALRTAGHAVMVRENRGAMDLVVDGCNIEHRFSPHERKAGGILDSRGTGAWHVTIRTGSYATGDGKSHSFPQRKDGTFDMERALPVLRKASLEVMAAERKQVQRDGNRRTVDALADMLGIDRLGIRNYFDIAPSESADEPVQVTINVTFNTTEDNTRALYLALRKLGVPVHRAKPEGSK